MHHATSAQPLGGPRCTQKPLTLQQLWFPLQFVGSTLGIVTQVLRPFTSTCLPPYFISLTLHKCCASQLKGDTDWYLQASPWGALREQGTSVLGHPVGTWRYKDADPQKFGLLTEGIQGVHVGTRVLEITLDSELNVAQIKKKKKSSMHELERKQHKCHLIYMTKCCHYFSMTECH